MKRILIALLFLLPVIVKAQTDDTTKYIYYQNTYGNALDRYWAKKVLRAPSDTIYSKAGLAILNGTLYVGNGVRWSQVTGTGGSTDTTSLSNRINQKFGYADTGYTHPVATPELVKKKMDSTQTLLNALILQRLLIADSNQTIHSWASVGRMNKIADSLSGLFLRSLDSNASIHSWASVGRINKIADSLSGLFLKTVSVTNSITGDGTAANPLKLSGDQATPADGTFYGKSAGAKGWFSPPSGFANPMTSPHDLIEGGTGGTPQRLATGTAHQVLHGQGAYGAVDLGNDVSGSLPEGSVTNLTTDLAGKQATGNYITALTGEVSAAGPGSASSTISRSISPTMTGNWVFNNPILTGTSNLALGGWMYNSKIYSDAAGALVVKDSGNKMMAIYSGNPANYAQANNFRQAVALVYNSLKNATIDTTTLGTTVFSDNFSRGSLGSAYTVATPGMTQTISSAGLELTAVTAPANYLNYVTRTDSLGWTCSENATIHIKYYNKAISSTSYGLMVGWHSQNAQGYTHTVLTGVQQYTGAPNLGKADLVGGDTQGYTAFASAGMSTISVGDTIDLTVTRAGLVYTVTAKNLNTAGTTTLIAPANQDGTPFPANNASTIVINFLGGDVVVTQLDYTLKSPYRPDYLTIGNSIAWGQGSGSTSSQAARFSNMAFAQADNAIVEAGGADYTANFVNLLPEFRRINPKAVIMGPLAGNDILFGISSGTWQANLQTIRDSLVHFGIPVIWFTDPPRVDVSTLPIRTYISGTSDFSTDQKIFSSYDSLVDAGTAMRTSYSGGGDGVHPNPNGHQKLGDLLAAALPVQTGLTRIKLPIPYGTGTGGSYTLPIATTSVLGGVKPDGVTTSVNSSTGVLSVIGGGGSFSGTTSNGAIAWAGPTSGLLHFTPSTLSYDSASGRVGIGANASGTAAVLQVTGTAANGNDASINLTAASSSAQSYFAFGKPGALSNSNPAWSFGEAASSSSFFLQNYNGSTLLPIITVTQPGAVRFNQYGTGTHTGTAAYTTQFDASGNLIEGPLVTIGNFSGTSTAKGLDVSSNAVTLHAADGTNPGAVSTTTQSFAGAKTFLNGISVTGNTISSGVISGSHYVGPNSLTLSNSGGTGAGTSPTLTVIGGDQAGSVSVTVGSSPSGSNANIITLTFNASFTNNAFVTLTPANPATAALTGGQQVYVTSTTSGFTIVSGSTALTASTTYVWYYSVAGM